MSSKLTDAMLTTGFAAGAGRPMLDPSYGGMNGWSPEYGQWVNNQAHVSRPVHFVLLDAPEMFDLFTNAAKWRQALKATMELHSYTIDGLDMELKVDVDSHALGGSGELQHEVTNVTRGVSTPKHQYVEKYGRPIQRMHEFWIRYGLMDPETKFALMGGLESDRVKDLTANWYAATGIYIQPCPLHKHVDRAWLRSNMFPGGAGVATAKRDLKSGQEITYLDIEYHGFMTVGDGVNALAQQILDTAFANRKNADPNMRKAHVPYGTESDAINPNLSGEGWLNYASQLGSVSSQNVTTTAGATTGNPVATSGG